jgi:NAD(P)-dependent dehydrogenase (short-subunit alcohol dehydrogenase family)
MGLLEGRRALVTGAARGIGLATSRRFREEGADVAVSDVMDVDAVAAELGAHAVPFDVTDEAAVDRGVERAAEVLGGLDVVVANAGVFLDRPVVDTSLADLRRVLDVNVVGAFLTMRAAARRFAEQGGGAVLATASQAGLRGYAGLGAYCASKFAVVGLVEVMAKELGPAGVRVACVAPGLIETAMYHQVVGGRVERTGEAPETVHEQLAQGVPLGRLGTPEDVANTFVYLASDLASYVSGTAVVIDGGEVS